jgi:hypothetical protein
MALVQGGQLRRWPPAPGDRSDAHFLHDSQDRLVVQAFPSILIQPEANPPVAIRPTGSPVGFPRIHPIRS